MKPWFRMTYISIGIVLVLFSSGLKGQEISPPAVSTAGPSVASGQAGEALPNLEINVPPPTESSAQRRWRERNRFRAEDTSEPRVFPVPGDGTPLSPNWSVTTPRQTRMQVLERSRSEDGYSVHREHTWTAPDGTWIRSHESDVTATGPNNFQRDRVITLRDGRSIEHSFTRSWDGETFNTQRSFSGPNGQTWTREHTWTPGSEEAVPDSRPAVPPQNTPPALRTPPAVPIPPEATAGNRFGQRNAAPAARSGSQPAGRPSGFTVGSLGRGGWGPGKGQATHSLRPPEAAPSLGKRLRIESPNSAHPGALRPSILPRPRGRR